VTVRLAAIVLLALAMFARGAGEDPPVRFASVDIIINASEPLAAWQVELSDEASVAVIVGIEGGDHPAFTAPPFYDPAAMQQGRIILAAYSTNADLPAGSVRVARVHVQITGTTPPNYVATLTTAGTTGAKKINATVVVKQGVGS
jgi:hypothetical protein